MFSNNIYKLCYFIIVNKINILAKVNSVLEQFVIFHSEFRYLFTRIYIYIHSFLKGILIDNIFFLSVNLNSI